MHPKQESLKRQSPGGLRAITAILGPLLAAVIAPACATAPPVELVRARTAYDRASAGPAAHLAAADLHKARLALDQAERALSHERDLGKTVDYAYIAERNAQIAEAHADTALAAQSTSQATRDLGEKQGEMAKQAAGSLTEVRAQLADAQRGEAQQSQQVGIERTAREAAEQKADASERKAQQERDSPRNGRPDELKKIDDRRTP